VFPDVKEIEMLEIVERSEVKKKQDGDNFAFRHFHRAISVPFTVSRLNLEFFVFDGKFFAKIVHNTENFSNFVFGKYAHIVFIILLIIKYKDNKNREYLPLFFFLFSTFLIPNSGSNGKRSPLPKRPSKDGTAKLANYWNLYTISCKYIF
jgi:hypothetical protein